MEFLQKYSKLRNIVVSLYNVMFVNTQKLRNIGSSLKVQNYVLSVHN